MRLYSYVVARDYGFAPNPFFGVCTLATCKPGIRRMAKVDDWVIGTGSKTKGLSGRLVYAMHVSEILAYDDYWRDPRFKSKRPNLNGSMKQAFGDNIYHRNRRTGRWIQANSHHSHRDGSVNHRNVKHDTQTTNVLVGLEFVYFGKEGPIIPKHFRRAEADVCVPGQGYKCRFPEPLVISFVDWLRSLGESGFMGLPADFPTVT
jgi:putative DNA base modification enzyme with NMAD domain